MSDLPVTVDADRVSRELAELATFSDAEPPAVTRVLYTDADLRARAFLKRLSADAGLAVREDPIGNLFARWAGYEPGLQAIGTGSHTDAIPHSGRYDGTVGVLGGLAAIRALQTAGYRPRRSIELLMFTSEEPTRFGIGCVGSRGLCGALSPERLADLRDDEGRRLDDVRQAAGFHGDLAGVRLPKDYYAAFVELHIEQGPILEREGIPIGIVTAIAAPAALRVTLDGEGGHAGAVLMPDRRDALCAAAEVVLAVEAAAKATGSPDTVATAGVCRVHPGAINSVPSRAHLEIDVRDVRLEPRDRAVGAIRGAVEDVSRRRGVRSAVELLNADPPAAMAEPVMSAAEAACQRLGLASKRMVSRAYHDSLYMARLCDTGMIFIPCRGGVSHRPDEYASPEAIANGVAVLANTLASLSTG
ncbi:MAG TPA: M20 family metallo-hydrolase [Gemmataceae bacterium]|jgi:N-carbamoyl-L-amino-acid hydrolase